MFVSGFFKGVDGMAVMCHQKDKWSIIAQLNYLPHGGVASDDDDDDVAMVLSQSSRHSSSWQPR